jgi:hypothetical protein
MPIWHFKISASFGVIWNMKSAEKRPAIAKLAEANFTIFDENSR